MKHTYMIHPKHGTHVAYDAEEIARCEANGWKIREDAKVELKVVPAVDFHDTPVEAPKRGRPRKVA